MAICPEGHDSTAADYCSVCGELMGAAPAPVHEACPNCGAPVTGRFCEACGCDIRLGVAPTMVAPAPPGTQSAQFPEPVVAPEPVVPQQIWVATVWADRQLFDRTVARKGPDAERVEFPVFYQERRIALHGKDFLIGKRSVSQGVRPEIDLGLAPVDIGVSRVHARLHIEGIEASVTDLGSTNGTSINGSDDLIPAQTPVPLRSGDRIHVGGWTTITLTTELG
ncbi:FHA domain-containing protein [Nocardia stercoris]|uniref:FHA domain-containing protein n=1 Tax=Nocardia stercoris TaxID=2483361 RepID=A0A3M2KVR6_9NOCA|nr:FHA domain-containing protein [Nocardia stercoris]RMI29687.1 FHA domain-containing protein [Nocardia stercoris]